MKKFVEKFIIAKLLVLPDFLFIIRDLRQNQKL